MDLLAQFRRCKICRKKRPKDAAKVELKATDGVKIIPICEECEKILDLANIAAHRTGDEDVIEQD